jgi:hypothetical protein
MLPVVVSVAVAISLIMVLRRFNGVLRDSLLVQMRIHDRSFSLARCQMAFWFVVIFSCWTYFCLSGADTVMSTDALTLMGISAGTGLAAVAVDHSKDIGLQDADAKLRALGLASRTDVQALDDEWEKLSKITNPPAAMTVVFNTLAAKRVAYRQIIAPYASGGNILNDLITDSQGPTLHRLQIVIWTLGMGVYFIGKSIASNGMPAFDENMLALMAISGGTYAGFKLPERQVPTETKGG